MSFSQNPAVKYLTVTVNSLPNHAENVIRKFNDDIGQKWKFSTETPLPLVFSLDIPKDLEVPAFNNAVIATSDSNIEYKMKFNFIEYPNYDSDMYAYIEHGSFSVGCHLPNYSLFLI